MHPLDRPVWATLSTHHRPLSEGNELARRFARDVNLFASARDDEPASLAALAELVAAGEQVYIAQVHEVVVPAGLRVVKAARAVQMVSMRNLRDEASHEGLIELGDADAPAMLALATLTEPGPFLKRTHAMGTFLGAYIGGQLAAMAGERMRLPGYTEVSGVCTHPAFRGHGLARRLSAAVTAAIQERDEQPFLHAWTSNATAIKLYESLGFVIRTEVNVAVLEKPAG